MQNLKTVHSQYKQLTDIEHVLLRAEMYAGSRQMTDCTKYLLHADNKIYADNIQLTPACLLFANELLCNSFDEAVRGRQSHKQEVIDNIDVVVDIQMQALTVTDNGGIPIAIDSATGMLIPTMIFGHLRTGSNYTDARGDTCGMNGIGCKICNIFARQFEVITADGQNKCQQMWHENMTVCDEAKVTESHEHFTRVTAWFDTDTSKTRLPENCYDMTWARCIEARCMELAAMAAGWEHPLTVTFTCINGEERWTNKFCFKRFEDYLKLWPNNDKFIIDKQYRFNVALGLSNGNTESSALVNGQQCPWGTHVDTFMNACIFHIRAHIQNRFKIDIKPAKIRSYFKIISTWQINAATFSGQTKEQLVSDIKTFGMPVIPSEQFIKKLLRSEIVQVIIEELHNRIAAQRKAEIAQQQREIDRRTKRSILPDKLADAANASKGKFCRLYVVEGDSAATGLKKFRNSETDGVCSMFGKSMGNSFRFDEGGVLANKALNMLCQALGFSFLGYKSLRYNQVIISTDADEDGSAIAGLLILFFKRFIPELIEQGRLYRLVTPIIAVHSLKTGETLSYYELAEFERDKAKYKGKDWQVTYLKGLASMSDDQYIELMKSPRLVQIIDDELADSSLVAWFGNDSGHRKELMEMAELEDDSVLNAIFADMQEAEPEYETF